jgi:hypothetical protein
MNVEHHNESKGSDYQRLILMGRTFCMINTSDINDISDNIITFSITFSISKILFIRIYCQLYLDK